MTSIDRWKGLRNTTAERRFKPGEMDIAQNVDIDDSEALRSRQGFTQVASGACHSIFAHDDICLFVQSSALKRLNLDETTTTLATLTSDAPMSFATVNGVVYGSNGYDAVRVANGVAGHWGLRQPVGQPVAAADAGRLPPGKYLYAITYLRPDGFEGGTGLPGMIELTTTGGIHFSSIQPSTYDPGCGIILYLSSPNGEVLYRAAVLPDGTTDYYYREDTLDLTVDLTNSQAYAAPHGQLVTIFNGIAYVAAGNTIYYSDPFNLELFRLQTNFLQLESRVTMMKPVQDGLYVGTETDTYFFAGTRPDKFESKSLFSYGVVPGTAVETLASLTTRDDSPNGADEYGEPDSPAIMWLSARGVCVGVNGGTAKNLTETVFSIPTGQRGAAIVRQIRGYSQYLASIQGTGNATNSYS